MTAQWVPDRVQDLADWDQTGFQDGYLPAWNAGAGKFAALATSALGRSLVGAADAAAGRTLLGLAAVAATGAYADLSGLPTLGTLAAQSSVTASQVSDSTTVGRAVLTAADAAAARSAIGAGTGNGSVTSVGLSVSGVLHDVTGSPVTGAGTLTLSLKTQTANTLLAGPSTGAAATPTFRALVAADLPAAITPTTVNGAFVGYDGTTPSGLLLGSAAAGLITDSTSVGIGVTRAQRCVVIGNAASVSGNTGGVGLGWQAVVTGAGATGMGQSVNVTGNTALGIGNSATASSSFSVAIGGGAVASTSTGAMCIGINSACTGARSVGVGYLCSVTANGRFSYYSDNQDPAFTLKRLTSGTATQRELAGLFGTWATSTEGSQLGRLTLSAFDNLTARESLRIEAQSGAAAIGFLGAAAVARQTGGAATAGTTYTTAEQGMVNRMYTALRNYGLLT